jgi:tetratricopeptide (TPR) repeat protein
MDISSVAECRQSLEQFRHLLFHLQMECGSIHPIFRFFKEKKGQSHFEALTALYPRLMTQLMAREHVLEARRADTSDQARLLLRKALELDPDCPEACFEMACRSETPEAGMMWYSRCMQAAERLLGKDLLNDLLENFHEKPWSRVEIYAWLKAKICLAEILFRTGHYDVAIVHFRELLVLDPADQLRVRYFLMAALLCEKMEGEAGNLFRQHRSDQSPAWYYCKAVLFFREDGCSRRSHRALKRAFQRNLWVAAYLLGLEALPEDSPGKKRSLKKAGVHNSTGIAGQKQPYQEGSRAEALDCLQCIAPVFAEDARLIWWVWEQLQALL